VTAQDAPGAAAVPLAVDAAPTDHRIGRDQVHTYTVSLEAGQFVAVVIAQKEVDVSIDVFAPGDGIKPLRTVNAVQSTEKAGEMLVPTAEETTVTAAENCHG
jgi:hypothetical protein